MANPTGANLNTFLEAQGFTSLDSSVANNYVLAAIKEFEDRVGFRPFYGEATSEERFFHAPDYGDTLDLMSGLVVIDSVEFQEADGTVIQELTENEDFIMLPLNSGYQKVPQCPYTQIRFLCGMTKFPNRISVSGQWAYSIADQYYDVDEAIMRLAAAKALTELATGFAVASKIRQGAVTIEDGGGNSDSKIMTWKKEAGSTIRRYARIVI